MLKSKWWGWATPALVAVAPRRNWLAIILLAILGTNFWNRGILPALVLKAIILKSKLVLQPPIALGAFAIGGGAGLLIGKLQGINLILEQLSQQHRPRHGKYRHKHVLRHRKPGWKPYRIRFRLPFFKRYRRPPIYYSYHSFPQRILSKVNYSYKPYGTYSYDKGTEHGWSTSSSVYGHSGTGNVNYGPVKTSYTSGISPGNSGWYGDAYVRSYTGDISQNPSEVYSPSSSPSDEDDWDWESYASSDSSNYGYKVDDGSVRRDSASITPRNDLTIDSSSDFDNAYKRYKKSVGMNHTALENYIVDEFVKIAKGDYNETKTEEIQKANSLISEHLKMDTLVNFEDASNVPEFIPFPDEDVIDDPMKLKASSSKIKQKPRPIKPEVFQMPFGKSLLTNALKTIKRLNPVKYIPDSIYNWIQDGIFDVTDMLLPSTSKNKDSTISTTIASIKQATIRNRREASTHTAKKDDATAITKPSDAQLEDITKSIVTDLRYLFRIVDWLDVGRCLERMICTIHSRSRKFTPEELGTTYEGTVVTAFRVMKSIMPKEADPSVMKYRNAAKIGSEHHSSEICIENFPGCPINTDSLIKMGSQLVSEANFSSVGTLMSEASAP